MIRIIVDYNPLSDFEGTEFLFKEVYEMADFIKQAQEYSYHTYFIEFFETEEKENINNAE